MPRSFVDSLLDRLVALVRRELGAADVRVLGPTETAPDATNALVARLEDGRAVVAVFETPPPDGEALTRRLTILVATFAESLADAERSRPSRSPIGSTLHDELRALSQRARARDVLVIDTESPVVWGSAELGVQPRKASFDDALRDVSHPRLVHVDSDIALPELESSAQIVDSRGDDESATSDDDGEDQAADLSPVSASSEARRLATRALRMLRAMPERLTSPKGKPARHVIREADLGCVAITFSGIYVLVLVFDGEFDELRAERAAQEALPRVERLVLALPPLDPDPQPMGQVVSLRRARRK